MKKLFTLSLLSILLIFGCDQGSTLTSPENVSNSVEILPDIPDSVEVIPWPPYPPGSDSIFIVLDLPNALPPWLIASGFIDGQVGGLIEIYHEFYHNKDTIKISATLEIQHSSFIGVEEISMVLHNDIGIISFYPHLAFDRPAILHVRYDNIDVSNIDPNTVEFIYQNYDGSIEQIDYKQIHVDDNKNYFFLDDAKLDHFSRYGWAR